MLCSVLTTCFKSGAKPVTLAYHRTCQRLRCLCQSHGTWCSNTECGAPEEKSHFLKHLQLRKSQRRRRRSHPFSGGEQVHCPFIHSPSAIADLPEGGQHGDYVPHHRRAISVHAYFFWLCGCRRCLLSHNFGLVWEGWLPGATELLQWRCKKINCNWSDV